MVMPTPPQLEAAKAELQKALDTVEQKSIDLVKENWDAIEKGVAKILGGPFQPNKPEHQVIALGLAGVLGERLHDEAKAFWFPYRESPEGAALGFPEALIMLAPFGAVVDALRSAKLGKLEDVAKEIRKALAQVKFSGGQPMQLSPEDYMRLFDPAFVQLVAVNPAKLKETWATTPDKLSRQLSDAVHRASKLPPEVKKQLEQQLVGALARMDATQPLIAQTARAPRIVEAMGILFSATGMTGAAAEEFWTDVTMPLMLVGAPDSFPPLDKEELDLAKQGVPPLFVYLDVVPFQHKAADEDGLLGVFPPNTLQLPDPAFQSVGQVRLIKVGAEAIKTPLATFDPAKSREALERFGKMLSQSAGAVTAPAKGADEAKMMFDAGLTLLGELKGLMGASNTEFYVRRLTEAEAASEAALSEVRQAISGPRIILTT
jgi:hypothetical protein